MKSSISLFILIISVAPFFCPEGLSQSANTLTSKIEEYVAPYVATQNFNGTILVAKGGVVLYENSFGFANADFAILNQSGTVYHIASVSKNFTAAAILMLEERGLLSTQDLLSKYIPDFTRAKEITIHHLLTHTSGIPNVNDMKEYAEASRMSQTPESLIQLFKGSPLNFNPGDKYSYSNSNYNVLAYIIEKVSGKTFGDFLEAELLKPSGMLNTAHHQNTNLVIKNSAVGYQSDGNFGLKKSDYLDWSSKTGNGSMYTTAHDLLKWDRALASGKALSKTSLEKMYTNHKANTGYGCFVKEHLKRKRVYMNGRSPGFTSYFARYPDDDVCIIVLANNYIPVATQMGMDIAAILFNEKYEPLKLSDKPVDAKLVSNLIGSYQFDKDFYRPNFKMTVSEKNGRLSIDWGELIPTGELTFIARATWSDVSFSMDAKGNVSSIDYDSYIGKRIE